MIRAIHLIAIALCWAAFAYKVRDLRRGKDSPALRALCAVLFLFASSVTVSLPPLYQRIPWLMASPSLVKLIQHELTVLAGYWMQVLFVRLTFPPDRTRAASRLRAGYAGASVLALIVLFELAPLGNDADDFVNQYAGKPFVTEYLLVFLGYLTVSLGDVFRLSTRYARHATQPFLRIGLRTMGAGVLIGVAFVLHKAFYALVRRFDGSPPWPEGPVSTILTGCAVLPFVVGATIAGWGPAISRQWDKLARYRAYRRLWPLWSATTLAMPNIAFVPPDTRLAGAGPWRTLDFRLYRRVIEIRDGRLALRPYLDQRVHDLARERGAAAGLSGADLDAVAEAATFAAALRARSGERAGPDAPAVLAGAGGVDLADEVRWLGRVADAYRRSPVVAAVLTES
ncbi:hypothetical protein F0L68_25870 [Solihabitans fulvus]|uniref:DUF6545 domain-containing protein n=1 Tax=Solihabitans fulvus TaxID=1892852 RepID=A0A5B2X1G4_9PSEU|nr:MAB_1171c family putative transporter [Solihabitans fulvus]KAA2256927.1 hypothetical protein F0L68_25870 [Solihabitans fulvus]